MKSDDWIYNLKWALISLYKMSNLERADISKNEQMKPKKSKIYSEQWSQTYDEHKPLCNVW
jgi:hypothetical protein